MLTRLRKTMVRGIRPQRALQPLGLADHGAELKEPA